MPRLKGPESDAIYSQYISYYNDCAAKIHAIDSLAPAIWSQANVQKDRDFLANVLASKTLYIIMQNDYDTTLEKYQSDCSAIESQIQQAFDDAMGGGNPFANRILSDLIKTQNDLTSLGNDLDAVKTVLGSSDTINKSLDALQTQIDLLVPGSQKDKAQEDLNLARDDFHIFSQNLPQAQIGYSQLLQSYSGLVASGGVLDQLVALSKIPNPNAGNADSADSLLSQVNAVCQQDQIFQSSVMSSLNTFFKTLQSSIERVQSDLNPIPSPGKVENACWYIDWTSWDFPVPSGVNVVNIFVGKLDVVDGTPSVSGFGNMNLLKLQDFVTKCSLAGVGCKISIGGGGGSYDNCWDLLTDDNISLFAQGLAKFCHENQLLGVDFDYEENSKDPGQCARVGALIKAFKKQDSSLQTSLCTNASFSGWSDKVKAIMDAAVDGDSCCLDRLYVMSYYDPMVSEQAWLSQWLSFLKTRYNMDASRLTVGIDNFDANAYDISKMAAWAATQGMSTGFWAFDPSQLVKSNASTNQIKEAYDTASAIDSLKKLQKKPIRSATKIQKLISFLFKVLHTVFVQLPRSIGSKFVLKRAQDSLAFSKNGQVGSLREAHPEPSAPPGYDMLDEPQAVL